MTDKVDEKVDKTEDYEKRFNDSQTHIKTIESENKAMREQGQKDKELFDQVSGFIDWDALNGKTKLAEDDEGYVTKKDLTNLANDLRNTINQNRNLSSFRSNYPDMVKHEDLVTMYYAKTDTRRTVEERIKSAVENARNLLESERVKGREDFEKEKTDAAKKEAEAAGLGGGKTPEGKKEEPEGETSSDYIKNRKAAQLQSSGGV
ncbi:hypothetical protein LCGC14_1009700 [marine sediment metagenome]|uniref:Uncharacterized protein n=1 Tax=marine sediment metagenome TaxID=412755 RepID=A0A0F9NM07_9ZZZZ